MVCPVGLGLCVVDAGVELRLRCRPGLSLKAPFAVDIFTSVAGSASVCLPPLGGGVLDDTLPGSCCRPPWMRCALLLDD